jgi:aspartate aminotransferase
LADAGAALLPGAAFARLEEEFTARLAYVDFDGACALAASENVPLQKELPADFTQQWCGRVLRGVERIVDWIGGAT